MYLAVVVEIPSSALPHSAVLLGGGKEAEVLKGDVVMVVFYTSFFSTVTEFLGNFLGQV